MAYVRKTTTLLLVFLLILTIGSFSFSIIHYQQSLTRLHNDIDKKTTEITGLASDVNSLKKELANLNSILDIQILREENLSEQYVTLKLENVKDVLKPKIEHVKKVK